MIDAETTQALDALDKRITLLEKWQGRIYWVAGCIVLPIVLYAAYIAMQAAVKHLGWL